MKALILICIARNLTHGCSNGQGQKSCGEPGLAPNRATLLIEDDDERQDQLLAAAIAHNKRKRAEQANITESND